MSKLEEYIQSYKPALDLEKVVSARTRSRLATFSLVLVGVSLLGVVVQGGGTMVGLLYIATALWLCIFVLDRMFYSYYFEGLESTLSEHLHSTAAHSTSYEAIRLIATDRKNILAGWVHDSVGREILLRAGLAESYIDALLDETGVVLDESILEGSEKIFLHDIARTLEENERLATYLFAKGVARGALIASAFWVEENIRKEKIARRLWGKDALGRIPSVGKDWVYGQAYQLEKYGSYIEETPYFSSSASVQPHMEQEVRLLESSLAKRREANALLVGETNAQMLEILGRFARHIKDGSILSPLEHKKIFILDALALVSSAQVKTSFEQLFIRLMNDAAKAGNLILVFDNFDSFVASAGELGSDVLALMDAYLDAPELNVIGLVTRDHYYGKLERNQYVSERFEAVKVHTSGEGEITTLLIGMVPEYEKRYDVMFMYPSLVAISKNAARYLTSGLLSDKAHDLVEELIPYVRARSKKIITARDVEDLVAGKTGIPTGTATGEEKELLLDLEEKMHQMVIGQDVAVKTIARTMRRARSGVREAERPIGSFLFLGPTGVGKTQTAKALAATYFGDKDAMLRFDMSEYASDDAVDKLIGSFESGKSGTLANALKENPYTVVLLDEFEKTTNPVKDLFLQIFDEGAFSDMQSNKIYARDAIFIATSNAGSTKIWDYFKAGEDVTAHTEELTDTIIREGHFKPELVNRFDAVVVFHPLSSEHLQKIAVLMLSKLQKRMAEQGIDVSFAGDVVRYVAEKGYDPKFGARPMNRVIQDDIEHRLAEMMLEGELQKGQSITLDRSSLDERGEDQQEG